MSIVSLVVPLVLGIVIGNIDKELGSFIATGMLFMIFALGFSVGHGINLLDAVRSVFSGVVMAIFYYILVFVPMFFVERKVFKRAGHSAPDISTIAGLSASVPMLMASNYPKLMAYGPSAIAIVTISSIVSPYLSKKLYNKNHTNKKINTLKKTTTQI